MKTEKRANRYHSDMDNDRVQTYRRIVSTMPVGLILCTLMCCPCGAHTLYFNVLSLWGSYSVLECAVPCGTHTLYFNVLSLWGSYSVL
jgi:hypothetical protein